MNPTIFTRIIRYGAVLALAVAVIGAVAGGLADGGRGVTSALIGAALAFVFTGVTAASILLADRVLKTGAAALSPTGKPFTANSIGGAIATRAIMADLRAGGDVVGGPAPFGKADRSRFLQALDELLVRSGRRGS